MAKNKNRNRGQEDRPPQKTASWAEESNSRPQQPVAPTQQGVRTASAPQHSVQGQTAPPAEAPAAQAHDTQPTLLNLDHLAFTVANEIASAMEPENARAIRDKLETVVRKALGVVQEEGPTAAMLYLFTRSTEETPAARAVRDKLLNIVPKLFRLQGPQTTGAQDALNYLKKHVSGDLTRLLLVKQVWEQTLIYARYAAKARQAS